MSPAMELAPGDIVGPDIEAAPPWFDWAIAQPKESRSATRDGCALHYLRWGDTSKPGLMLVHGNGAHAEWWSFVAPLLSDTHCVVAVDLAGMGDSGTRPAYNMAMLGEDLIAVAEHAGLFDVPEKPVILGHSFGGFVTIAAAKAHGERLAGVIIADSPIRPPEDEHPRPARRTRPHDVFPTLEAGLARFRLVPAQPCENRYIVDYIGRHSLKPVEGGYIWKFDPTFWATFEREESSAPLQSLRCRVSLMRGEHSILVTPKVAAYMEGLRPQDPPMVSVPLARHHLMLDQPIAFATAVRAQLAAWAPLAREVRPDVAAAGA